MTAEYELAAEVIERLGRLHATLATAESLTGGLIGAALTAAGPALGIIDVRFMPFFQLSLALCGAAAAGLWVERLAVPRVAALGLVLLAAILLERARAGVLLARSLRR